LGNFVEELHNKINFWSI